MQQATDTKHYDCAPGLVGVSFQHMLHALLDVHDGKPLPRLAALHCLVQGAHLQAVGASLQDEDASTPAPHADNAHNPILLTRNALTFSPPPPHPRPLPLPCSCCLPPLAAQRVLRPGALLWRPRLHLPHQAAGRPAQGGLPLEH